MQKLSVLSRVLAFLFFNNRVVCTKIFFLIILGTYVCIAFLFLSVSYIIFSAWFLCCIILYLPISIDF